MVWVYGNSSGRVGRVLPVNYVLRLERILGSYFGMTFGVVNRDRALNRVFPALYFLASDQDA